MYLLSGLQALIPSAMDHTDAENGCDAELIKQQAVSDRLEQVFRDSQVLKDRVAEREAMSQMLTGAGPEVRTLTDQPCLYGSAVVGELYSCCRAHQAVLPAVSAVLHLHNDAAGAASLIRCELLITGLSTG